MGERNTAGGFKWRYKNDNEIVEISNKNDDSLLNSSPKGHTYVDNKKARPVYQLTKDGEFINRFNSITEASNTLNIINCNIHMAISGTKQSAGGFKWKYAD